MSQILRKTQARIQSPLLLIIPYLLVVQETKMCLITSSTVSISQLSHVPFSKNCKLHQCSPEYNKLVAKVDNIDTTGFVLKT